ncbi:MAG: glutamate--tRNA ligase [Acholeplasmataceae bacterium]
MKKVRTRYAPSPTGTLHIGNARTALFNYLFAKHHNGDFIIRIEDTDTERNVDYGVSSQLNDLSWLGIKWDEGPDIGGPFGPYFQLKRLKTYQEYAHKLLEEGLAYKDYKEGSDDYAIRFKVPLNQEFIFDDVIRGKLKFLSEDVEDWIILKDNGIPTYNFAVVIDDHFMEITHVFRGEEHITNTPKQVMIYEAFNWELPTFGHMTLIVNENRQKLSKRDVNTIQFISQYKELGYLPDAIVNFLSLLGWSPSDEEEIFNLEDLIKIFDTKRLSSSPSYFDPKKLRYVNEVYMKKLTIDQLKDLTLPFLKEDKINIISDDWLNNLLLILKDRLTYGAEITKYYHEFFDSNFKLDDNILNELLQFDYELLLNELLKKLNENPFNDSKSINDLIKEVGTLTNNKGKSLFMPIRIATTGETHGPSLPTSILLLGKETTLKRINETIKRAKGAKA